MTCDVQRVLDVARAEVGYREKASNANLDAQTANAGSANYTKYARDLDALGFYNGRKQGVAWCDVFVDWCFVKAYGLDAALSLTFQPMGKNNCGAGCKYSRNYYKAKGRLFDVPQPGDQVFFFDSAKSGIAHTGLVETVDNAYVYTIEGNTGNAVARKKYARSYDRFAGFGRPDYASAPSDADVPPIAPEQPSAGARTIVIRCSTGKVNIRQGDSTEYASIKQLADGTSLEYVATSAASGWHAVRYKKCIAWVSPKYAVLQDD